MFCSNFLMGFDRSFTQVLTFCIATICLLSCNNADVELINDVKRSVPRWMALSEQATIVEQKLSITQRRYKQDLETVTPYLREHMRDSLIGMSGSEVGALESQYLRLMEDRNRLHERFKQLQGKLKDQVLTFNTWEMRIMKNKVNRQEAEMEFYRYVSVQQEIQRDLDQIENELRRNVEAHNKIFVRLSQLLKLYQSFKIET